MADFFDSLMDGLSGKTSSEQAKRQLDLQQQALDILKQPSSSQALISQGTILGIALGGMALIGLLMFFMFRKGGG